jgi:uncharacterized protein (TIGR02145 family)
VKKKLRFFLLLILLLIGFSFCSKEELIPILGEQVLGLPFFLTTDNIIPISCRSACSGGYIIDNVGGCYAFTIQGVCWSTTPNPTTGHNKTIDKFDSDSDLPHFHSILTGLSSGTTYYIRAFASTSAGTAYGNEVSFTTPACIDPIYGSVSDIEGNAYRTIQIGTQTWMAENLRTTKFNDGSNIWTVGAYYWYNNDPVSFKDTYGALYNWHAVNTGKLCPTGWHAPSDEEWKQLEMALGMSKASADSSYVDFDVYGMGYRGTDQGTQMKATSGWSTWEGRGGNGTNTSGFSALPAGDTGWDGIYECAGVSTSYWCFGDPPIARTLGSDESKVSRAVYYTYIGFSVRCLKD